MLMLLEYKIRNVDNSLYMESLKFYFYTYNLILIYELYSRKVDLNVFIVQLLYLSKMYISCYSDIGH